jgi:hypothetical protein
VTVFGDFEADLWGVLVNGPRPMIAVSSLSGAESSFVTAATRPADAGGLTVVAPGLALRIAPASEERTTITATESAGRLTPMWVSGAATVDGSERELEVGGLGLSTLAPKGAGSVRLFAGWFPAGRAVALLAVRAADAKGHDRDEIEVAALGEEHPLVLDPRLSTTYDGSQEPIRIGIELWLTDSPEDEEQWSRRVAGQATGSRVTAPAPLPPFSAYALRCVSRGETGAGVFLLAPAH